MLSAQQNEMQVRGAPQSRRHRRTGHASSCTSPQVDRIVPMLNKTCRSHFTILRPRLCAGALLLSVCLGIAQNRALRFGSQPYTPTRLEWLAVELNSSLRVELSTDSQYSMDFVPIAKDDAILIAVTYLPGVQREVMNITIESAKKLIDLESKARGWTAWLKVQEHVEMKEIKTPK
jgi:hypothetical protein